MCEKILVWGGEVLSVNCKKYFVISILRKVSSILREFLEGSEG